MKNLSFALLGAAITACAFLVSSATLPGPQKGPSGLRGGGSVFGLNLVRGTGEPLVGIGPNTPVSIRKMDGDWIQVDFPNMKTAPTWINVNNIVSYRPNL